MPKGKKNRTAPKEQKKAVTEKNTDALLCAAKVDGAEEVKDQMNDLKIEDDTKHQETANKLKRFLYTNDYTAVHFSGNPEKSFVILDHATVKTLAAEQPDVFIKVLTEASQDKLLPRRQNLFYALAVVLSDTDANPGERVQIRDLVLKLAKSDDEFFDFVKYHTGIRAKMNKQKFSTTLRKLVVKFYGEKSPTELAKSVSKFTGAHKWTHKDLIKLAHVKCEDIVSNTIITYVLKGAKSLDQLEASTEVHSLLTKSRKLKNALDTKEAAALITELKASIEQVNSNLSKNAEVWYALIPFLSIRETLQHYLRFYHMNIFHKDNQFKEQIFAKLKDKTQIATENLHPIEVYIYMKSFQKGGKPMDPKLVEHLKYKFSNNPDQFETRLKRVQPICTDAVHAITSCLRLSYDNFKKIGKHFLIAVDIMELESECFHNRNVLYYEAVYSIIQWMVHMKEHFTLVYFKDNNVEMLDYHKWRTASNFLETANAIEPKPLHITPCAPLKWALSRKKKVDIFINFYSPKWYTKLPNEQRAACYANSFALKHYADGMKLPEAKLVKIFLGSSVVGKVEENTKNMLTVAGFSLDVPKILQTFFMGTFY